MRTVALANNRLGRQVCEYLLGRDELAAVIVHPPNRREHMDDVSAFGIPVMTWPDGFETVRSVEPHYLISVLFGYKVPGNWLSLARQRPLNLHPGLLPYNAGACPNVWPLVDGTPAGTTLHVMEAEIDAGPILAQQEVPTYPEDTAETLHQRLQDASLRLFVEHWPSIEDLEPVPQTGDGTHHRLDELSSLDPTPEAFHLIDRLRARTYPPYGAEFIREGARFRIRVEIERLGDAEAP